MHHGQHTILLSSTLNTHAHFTSPQDLLYTLAAAALLLAGVALVRLLAAAAYAWRVSPQLHPFLVFPRLETTVAGLALVALAFYAALSLGGPRGDWDGSRGTAAAVLLLLVLSFMALQWWLALGRALLVRSVGP